ncbi:MAG: Hsp20/alpha crystallin family protein [Chitinophagales bacterium]|nr:Hsp20/alpha crystallin family protein [Chitinophagales bacterium]
MIYPDIKTFRENLRDNFISPLSHRPHFLGRNALDVRWNMNKPAINIKKQGTLMELEVAMPGYKKEEISINIAGDTMCIRAEKVITSQNHPTDEYVIKEFGMDLMERKFRLASGLNQEKITAIYENGILKVTFIDIPKEEESLKTKVEIG